MPAANADTTDGLDSHLPRVDVSTSCNCGRCVRNPLCLVSFATHRAVHEGASVLSEDDEDFFPVIKMRVTKQKRTRVQREKMRVQWKQRRMRKMRWYM